MAALFDKGKGITLGAGKLMPPGSLLGEALLSTLVRYRRSVASGYSRVGLDELSSVFAAAGKGEVFLSEKLDGELWFLVVRGKETFLANSRGRVIHGNGAAPFAGGLTFPFVGSVKTDFGAKARDR